MEADKKMEIQMPPKPSILSPVYLVCLIIGGGILAFCVGFCIKVISSGFASFGVLFGIAVAGIIGYLFLSSAIKDYRKECELYRLAQTDFDEYAKIKAAQIATLKSIEIENAERMEREQKEKMDKLPYCPICGKKENVVRISSLNRTASVATFGLASAKIGKQYECKHCKHLF